MQTTLDESEKRRDRHQGVLMYVATSCCLNENRMAYNFSSYAILFFPRKKVAMSGKSCRLIYLPIHRCNTHIEPFSFRVFIVSILWTTTTKSAMGENDNGTYATSISGKK